MKRYANNLDTLEDRNVEELKLLENECKRLKEELIKFKEESVKDKEELRITKQESVKDKEELRITKKELVKDKEELRITKQELVKDKEELIKTQKKLNKSEERVSDVEMFLKQSKSHIFKCKHNSPDFLYCSKFMFNNKHPDIKKVNNCLNSYFNYSGLIHPEDKSLFSLHNVFFSENNGKTFSIIYRVKQKDNTYKWYYLLDCLCTDPKDPAKSKCICFLKESDNDFFAKDQAVKLAKEFKMEKYPEIKSKLNDVEFEICTLLVQGFNLQAIQELMQYKSISSINERIQLIKAKLGVTNKTSLRNYLYNLNIFG